MIKLSSQVTNALAEKIAKAINTEIKEYNLKIQNTWKEGQRKSIENQINSDLDPLLTQFEYVASQYGINKDSYDAQWVKNRVLNAALNNSENEMKRSMKQYVDVKDIRTEILVNSIEATTLAEIEESMRKLFING